ncbi:hypothetical protein FRX31_021465 [Thalictrum thalictroides]|uniref:RNase H type-1 domain-containing protein n=1 Tax=Thalictrum thalictroides TaxID=46969 RepID=A0A7J6VV34_THATH|nr:hypothetical protein FRX31_021465 [Thalictrum thalictroides]
MDSNGRHRMACAVRVLLIVLEPLLTRKRQQQPMTVLHYLHGMYAKLNFSKELYENLSARPPSLNPSDKEVKTYEVISRLVPTEAVEPSPPLGTLVTSGIQGISSDNLFWLGDSSTSAASIESTIQAWDSMAIELPPLPSNDNAHTTTEVVTGNVGHRTEALSSLINSEIVEPSNVGTQVSTDIQGIQNYGGPPLQTLTSEEIDAIQRTSMDFHDYELSTEITPGGSAASSEQAECAGILAATRWALLNRVRKVVMETDCRSAAEFLKGNAANLDWSSTSILLQVLDLFKSFDSFSIQFCNRSGNVAAHVLAQHTDINILVPVHYSSLPSYLMQQIEKDKLFCNISGY